MTCCLIATACAGEGLVSDRQVARERVNAYLAAHSATDNETVTAMRRFELRAGMSKQEVAATWGRPVEIQKWRSGTVDLWYFGCDWPTRCEAPDRRGILDDPIRADAFFRKGRLYQWSSP
ncbi:MAG: hypothetical protein ACI9JL_002342 [Paracoccaceae bacterium]|jgi:hypothetical protein